MSIANSSLENQNRIVRATGRTTATTAGSTSIYINIPHWPSEATVDRIVVTANNTFSSMTATILTDGAAHRQADTASKQSYIIDSKSDTATNVYRSSFVFGGLAVIDANLSQCAHILLTSTSAFTAGTVFTVAVEGHKSLTSASAMSVGVSLPNFRILSTFSSGTTQDQTQNLLRNGNPYALGGLNNSESFAVLSTAADYIYVGSARKHTKFMFLMSDSARLPSGLSLTSEMWNGSSWVSTTALNNTSDGQTTQSTFSYPGTIDFAPINNWTPNQVASDPMKLMEDAIKAGIAPPQGMFNNPDRYWIRLSVAGLSQTLKLISVTPHK